ncbi:hypothetical protein M408DRAFT_77779 [Serendipita vermifera MAFF 305830]|uniref:F-box domain-containing protein n=1 Tax=Serendipita vermifera MAFF 305830 TaxID=933852 RepID=A0A0C3AVN0_SERVB|nr:hypothetical protein M408DRAFT_77779 [Serendipita vermifera MAFF 305830]
MNSQYVPLGQLQDVITLSTVNQTSRRKHARGAPIQKLPAEMLGNIFAFCQTEWNCVSVESLMAVSSTWMGVCLGMPSLWTKISLHMTHWDIPNLSQMRSNYVYHHIVRSGVLPLQVKVNLFSRPGQETSAREHVRNAQAVLDFLFNGGPTNKGARYWDVLEFSFDSTTPRRLLDFLGTSMPRLRELVIDGPNDSRIPILQVPTLCSLSRGGVPEPAGHNPAMVQTLHLSTTALSREDVDRLSAYTSLKTLSIVVEKGDGRLSKLHLPNLVSLEITIKYPSSSSGSSQSSTEEPVSLRFLVLPHLHTLKAKGDNPSLIALATLQNLSQVRRLELKEWEFLAQSSRRTKWGFLAYTMVQTPAMAWNPSESVVEFLLLKCTSLEEVHGFPDLIKLVKSIIHQRPDLTSRLRVSASGRIERG